jgi:hypothetical protein
MSELDYRYFQRRAAEELQAADRAMHPVARESHLELSRRFDAAAAGAGERSVVEFPRHGQLKRA